MSDPDMALRLVDECRARGVALIAEGGDLTCVGPGHALTSALLDALRIHKPVLLRTMGGTTGTGEEPRDGSPPMTSAADGLHHPSHFNSGIYQVKAGGDSDRGYHRNQIFDPTSPSDGGPPDLTRDDRRGGSRGKSSPGRGDLPGTGSDGYPGPADGRAGSDGDRPGGGDDTAPRPRPLPWRDTVGSWPIRWRQLWGDRANALQDSGLVWYEAERRAFEEACLRLTRGDERPR